MADSYLIKIKLQEVLPKTSTTVYLKADESLYIDHYDFSSDANDRFGNDIAFTVRISKAEKEKWFAILMKEAIGFSGDTNDASAIFELIAKRFSSFFQLKNDLKEKGIEIKEETDGWA